MLRGWRRRDGCPRDPIDPEAGKRRDGAPTVLPSSHPLDGQDSSCLQQPVAPRPRPSAPSHSPFRPLPVGRRLLETSVNPSEASQPNAQVNAQGARTNPSARRHMAALASPRIGRTHAIAY